MEMKEIVAYNEQQIEHVRLFQQLVREFCNKLMEEAINHDQSKFSAVEYEAFVKSRSALNNSQTGTDAEYQKHLNSEAIQHHIKNNKHHPEYWDERGETMPIHQAILMYFDWTSRCEQKGTTMDSFWNYNTAKLQKQPLALGVAEAMKATFRKEET